MSSFEWGLPQGGFLFIGLLIFIFLIILWRQFRSHQFALYLIKGYKPFKDSLKQVLLLLTWSFAVLAYMQPRKSEIDENGDINKKILEQKVLDHTNDVEDVIYRKKAHDLVFLLDASASMTVKDTRSGQSRFELAKEIIDEVARLVQGDTVALYTFTSEVTPVVPLTLDVLYLRLLLPHVKINEGDVAGTDFFALVDQVKKKHLASKNKCVTLVLLSDGGDTYLETLQGEVRKKQLDTLMAHVDSMTSDTFSFFTIGMGSAQGADIPNLQFEGKPIQSTLDESLLTDLSEHGKGKYYFANEVTSYTLAQNLWALLEKKDQFLDVETRQEAISNVKRTVENEKTEPLYHNFFQIPLALAILFLLTEHLLPYFWRKESYA